MVRMKDNDNKDVRNTANVRNSSVVDTMSIIIITIIKLIIKLMRMIVPQEGTIRQERFFCGISHSIQSRNNSTYRPSSFLIPNCCLSTFLLGSGDAVTVMEGASCGVSLVLPSRTHCPSPTFASGRVCSVDVSTTWYLSNTLFLRVCVRWFRQT